jgi:hypothetical protein
MRGLKEMGFPLTPDPPIPWPAPNVARGKVELIAEGFLLWESPDLRGWSFEPLLEEVIIRELMALDCLDDSALIAFVNAHGVVTRRHPAVVVERPESIPVGRAPNHLYDVRQFLLDAQRCAATWLAWKQDRHIYSIWYDPAFVEMATKRPQARRRADDDSWIFFALSLNLGLTSFPPRVLLQRVDPNVPAGMTAGISVGDYRPDLYSALCIQLWNLLLANPELLTCANETCGRLFVKQRGGAAHGQYRSKGVLYCTPSCAQAQWQREYRRRKSRLREAT